jgi:hypothetical protein
MLGEIHYYAFGPGMEHFILCQEVRATAYMNRLLTLCTVLRPQNHSMPGAVVVETSTPSQSVHLPPGCCAGHLPTRNQARHQV